MCERSIAVWFVCRLCRGSFGQVDAFIEHKKQKHFTQFQNTTSIVFEESEQGEQCPIIKAENQVVDESNEPPIKIEVYDEDPINPFSLEIIEEPNLCVFEPKSELITYETEINPENENNFFGLEQPQPNPYVLTKRLTCSEEIQRACVTEHHSRHLTFKQKDFVNTLDAPSGSADVENSVNDLIKVENSIENEPSSTVTNISTDDDLRFECKLCSKKLQSKAQLMIHVGICALYHKDRHRFCVICNRKLCNKRILKVHRLRLHGTEEEKSSLYKVKCHLCPKKYQQVSDLRFHLLKSHHENKDQVETSNSKPKKCPHRNCGKEFPSNSKLQRHINAVHSGPKSFSCSFPKCYRKFSQKAHLENHFRTHTGERRFKCTVDNCNRAFATINSRSIHRRSSHPSKLSEVIRVPSHGHDSGDGHGLGLDINVNYDSTNSISSNNLGMTKRRRTAFEDHQLRTMNSFFAINQNPDAKDMKQLAQNTGLTKGVLLVWFKNARAKWRRDLQRGEGD